MLEYFRIICMLWLAVEVSAACIKYQQVTALPYANSSYCRNYTLI